MKHFKHILAATDLSPESLSSVSYAAHLARAQGSRLTVLHVPHSVSLAYTDFAPPIDMSDIDQAIMESARQELSGWVKRHLRKVPGVKTVVRAGITHKTICDVADEVGASVIVVTTHGRKGLGRLVLGSVTEAVLRDAPCPVLVVKPPKPVINVGTRRASTKKKSRKKASKKRK